MFAWGKPGSSPKPTYKVSQLAPNNATKDELDHAQFDPIVQKEWASTGLFFCNRYRFDLDAVATYQSSGNTKRVCGFDLPEHPTVCF